MSKILSNAELAAIKKGVPRHLDRDSRLLSMGIIRDLLVDSHRAATDRVVELEEESKEWEVQHDRVQAEYRALRIKADRRMDDYQGMLVENRASQTRIAELEEDANQGLQLAAQNKEIYREAIGDAERLGVENDGWEKGFTVIYKALRSLEPIYLAAHPDLGDKFYMPDTGKMVAWFVDEYERLREEIKTAISDGVIAALESLPEREAVEQAKEADDG